MRRLANIMTMFEQKCDGSLETFVALRAGIIMACWLFVMIAILIDFWSGTSTAKALGEPLMSKGFRRSVAKFGDYFKILLFALMFDALGTCFLHFYYTPFMTILTTGAVLLIEGKSVVENSRRKKTKAADLPAMIRRLLKAAASPTGKKIMEEISELSNHKKETA